MTDVTPTECNILDCLECRSIPNHVASPSRGDDAKRLSAFGVVWSDWSNPDRWTTQKWQLASCPSCSTYYWHYDYCDTEDSFAAGPQIVDEWWRCSTPAVLAVLAKEGLVERRDELVARHPADIAAYRAAIADASMFIGDHLLAHVVSEVALDLISTCDWQQIVDFLLAHDDARVRHKAATHMLSILMSGPPRVEHHGTTAPDIDAKTYARAHTIKQRHHKVVSTLKKAAKRR